MNNTDDNLRKFAKYAQSYDSRYMTAADREQMIMDLYELEGGELNKPVSELNLRVNDELSHLILLGDKKYPWDKFVSKFTDRSEGEDLAEVVARDLLLIEQVQKMYKKIANEEIDEKFESPNTLEEVSFAIAKDIDFNNKFKNYTV